MANLKKDILHVTRKLTVHNYWPEMVNMDGNKVLRILNIMNVSQHMLTQSISHITFKQTTRPVN